MSARDEIRSYVRLLADWWTPPTDTDRRVEEVYSAVRVEVLNEAAEEADRAGGVYASRGDDAQAGAAFALMEKYKEMADPHFRCDEDECRVSDAA